MKHTTRKRRSGKVRQSDDSRMMTASRFKVLCADSGLSIYEIGKFLHVTPRTVRYWLSGESLVPYSAYRLLRVLRMYELPQPGWEGWRMHSGKLWTPEGFPIEPTDGSWWSLLVRQARCFRAMYQRSGELERALMRLATTANTSVDVAVLSGAVPVPHEPAERARGAAEPPPNLLKEHIPTSRYESSNSLGVTHG
jgi:DNA-binding transcriptional regulator YiaG